MLKTKLPNLIGIYNFLARVDELVNGKSLENPIYLLADNGSFEADSTLSLRHAAHFAGLLADVEILPVSLLHSSKIDPSLLGGIQGRHNGGFFDWSHCSIRRPVAHPSFFLWSQPGLDPMAAPKTRSMEERKERAELPHSSTVFIKLGKTVWRRLWKIFVSDRSKRTK